MFAELCASIFSRCVIYILFIFYKWEGLKDPAYWVWVDGLELERILYFCIFKNTYRSLHEHLHCYVQRYVVGTFVGYAHLLCPTLCHRDADRHEVCRSIYTGAPMFNGKVPFLMPLIPSDTRNPFSMCIWTRITTNNINQKLGWLWLSRVVCIT
jgi:hypothetical protein